jgi:pimeloyl-ACP methyl ester carboxylesterase
MRVVGDEFRRSLAAVEFTADSNGHEPLKKADCVLMGRIDGILPENKPVAVTVFRIPDKADSGRLPNRLVDYNLLPAPGPYALFVPEGRYHILAFIDANRNYILEENEAAGAYGRPDAVAANGRGVVRDLNITLKAGPAHRLDAPISLQKLPYCKMVEHSLAMGGTVDLENDAFARKYASMGLWQPQDFIDRIGIHIFALEPYDARKLPVLFIHGISGSPRDWRYLSQHIDRRRFQCWFYYYPTGTRLDTTADLLHEKIEYLYDTLEFKRLYVVAHSMGGLVARAFIDRQIRDNDAAYIPAFITISTPWGGDKSARLGVKTAPVTVDSWNDIAAGSPFIENLHRTSLPDHLRFHLFYSYGGNKRVYWGANDGTVTVSSQLYPSAKSEACRVQGFCTSHMGTLYSALTANELNRTLLTADAPGRSTAAAGFTDGRYDGKGDLPSFPAAPSSESANKSPADRDADEYIRMLQSIDSVKKREAARHVVRKQLADPRIFATAASELMQGYLINLSDSRHVDAMAWMCNLLGASGNGSYRPTLEKVARKCPNRKITRYARRNLRKLR